MHIKHYIIRTLSVSGATKELIWTLNGELKETITLDKALDEGVYAAVGWKVDEDVRDLCMGIAQDTEGPLLGALNDKRREMLLVVANKS